jgi:uncharacterized short protein YbdD (DUF466 family)
MTFSELSEEQKHDVKENFLISLADKDMFIRQMKEWHPDKYSGETEERWPSLGEMADADILVPDEVMEAEGVDYCEDDFSSSSASERSDIDRLKHWIIREVTTAEYMSTHPESTWMHDVLVNSAVHAVMSWARLKIIEKCEEMGKEA